MKSELRLIDAVTVTLNPAIDRTITIPNFTAGAVNRVEEVRSNPGGKGVNVASALADYGIGVAVTGFLGRENSASFEALFERKQIVDHFVRLRGETRFGIKISDPVLKLTTDINLPGLPPAAADLDALRRKLEGFEALDARWFVLAGSLPPAVDPAIYREMTRVLRSAGRKVLLDTSGTAMCHALDAAPNIIKPNIDELGDLIGRRLPNQEAVIEAARNLVARGIALVVVSMGAEGACFVTADDFVVARPPRIEVKSTVGAGDAMVAGIIVAQLRGLPLDKCARLATAFSVNALAGSKASVDSVAAIDSAMQEVTLTQAA